MVSRKVTRVTVDEAKRNLEELLEELVAGDSELLIEQDEVSVFVVLPLDAYDRKRRAREAVAEFMRIGAERANLSPEEADKLAAEAVEWARANKEA
jgi:PHD/YefM family antitoxin component YafN of YafNO toxin-antitoxin module